MGQFARIPQLVAQVVTQSDGSGNAVALSGMSAQMVTQSTSKGQRVAQLTAQAITTTTPKATKVAQLLAQVLVQSGGAASGGWVRDTALYPQVVYSIGVEDTPRQKAWTFDFDGHTFYVLDLAERGALAFNTTTKSWSKFETEGYEGHWNAKNGFHWRDGKMVVAGGLLDGLIVRLDEDTFMDEGFRPVTYEVQGVVFASREQYIRQFNLRLIGSSGRTGLDDTVVPPTLRMQYSDDNGATWSTERLVTLTTTPTQRIEFRSLGAFRQPGRIFRLFDSGGIKFLAYVMADVEGE